MSPGTWNSWLTAPTAGATIAEAGAIDDHALDRNCFPEDAGLQRLGG